MRENIQPKHFKISSSKVMKRLFLGAALVLGVLMAAGCANNTSPAAVETPTPIPATASPSETPLPAATLTPTATEEVVEGISSVEEIKARIDDYLSGKEDYSVTGPNKDYLFVDDSRSKGNFKKIPFSTLSVWKNVVSSAVNWSIGSRCQQEGVYLGSYILDSEDWILSAFGTQRPFDKKPIVEFFTIGLLIKPDYLPQNLFVAYAYNSEKNPTWFSSTNKRVSGREMLKVFSGKENKIIGWDYSCALTPEGYNYFISKAANEEEKKFTEWVLNLNKNNEELVSWLQGSSEIVPDYVAFNGKEVDFTNFDGEKLPRGLNFFIPAPPDIFN